MRSMSSRMTIAIVLVCLSVVAVAAGIGAVGILGVMSAKDVGNSIAHDEVTTQLLTARVETDMAAAYSTSQRVILTTDPSTRIRLKSSLSNQLIPAVEAELAGLRAAHADDGEAELAAQTKLADLWATARSLLNTVAAGPTDEDGPALEPAISGAFHDLTVQLAGLATREQQDAADKEAAATSSSKGTAELIVALVGVAAVAAAGLGWLGNRRLRRALEPAQNQIEFADNLQLAQDEGEAHHLLQQHLERTISGSAVTVLNRNNSADRLEAVTTPAAQSPLVRTLQHAEPSSCLAVRSGRPHDEDEHRPVAFSCSVCGSCSGRSTCTPLTVGGVVIGSVLLNRAPRFNRQERQVLADSVAQAAPVLANLRNLAIAELRAATDSLTGLPNKRAVADTLKRMLAQASRTLTPLALLMLDLDHFKEINDRFGHPVGDQALASVGAALRSALRDSDFAGRNGGEEFAVMLPDTDVEGALATAEKIRAAIADITLPDLDAVMTASIGVAGYPEHATSTERLERLADSALYLAKRNGRNRVESATLPGFPTEIAEMTA